MKITDDTLSGGALASDLTDEIDFAVSDHLREYFSCQSLHPLFVTGDALEVLSDLPSDVFDCCMTSPPYWRQREYAGGGIGLEGDSQQFVRNLCRICAEIKRVLKPTGSFWLVMGDTYHNKSLTGIPWRVAMTLMDEQGWTLRNSVVWHKMKGAPDNTRDRLRNVHETVFHFVREPKGYYYDADSIRSTPKMAKVVNGAIVSASGVKGVRYKRQIELSSDLTDREKHEACAALDEMLQSVARGEIADFRMIIRGRQRATHSDSERLSGRAKELGERGFYFLKYHPGGSKPSDVWEILPEDTQRREKHFAPYPEDLCRIPILATSPPGGLVLDPFCGTGTTTLVANQLGRRAVGIDISSEYIELARKRVATQSPMLL